MKTMKVSSHNRNDISLNRRQFLRTAGGTAALLTATAAVVPSILSAPAPNATIGVGCIGIGTRGGDLVNAVVAAPNVKVVAVSDVYEPHRPDFSWAVV